MAWTPHAEGDAVTLSGVNANLTALQASVNTASANAITGKSLHAQHLPSVLGEAISQNLSGVVHVYSSAYPGYGVDEGLGIYGWEVVDNGPDELSVTFPILVDLTKGSVLVMANVMVDSIQSLGGTSELDVDAEAAIKIQVSGDGVTWRGITRTERFMHGEEAGEDNFPDSSYPEGMLPVHADIPIRTLVTISDVVGDDLRGIRVVASVNWMAALPGLGEIALSAATLTAIHIKSAV